MTSQGGGESSKFQFGKILRGNITLTITNDINDSDNDNDTNYLQKCLIKSNKTWIFQLGPEEEKIGTEASFSHY